MIIRITGKDGCLQKLEKAQSLIKEAEMLLHQIPMEIKLEVKSDTGGEVNDVGEHVEGISGQFIKKMNSFRISI